MSLLKLGRLIPDMYGRWVYCIGGGGGGGVPICDVCGEVKDNGIDNDDWGGIQPKKR